MHYDSGLPIYQQIMMDIKMKIVTGEFGIDMQIPPVREIALVYEVNPNTMQRALSELERAGYLYTKRTAGRFVIHDEEHIEQLKQEMLVERVDRFLSDMNVFHIKDDAFIAFIKERMGLQDVEGVACDKEV